MPSLARSTLLSAVLAALAPAATTQSLNIDIGTLGGTPQASYGGAAAQPGVWNAIPGGVPDHSHPLVALDGQPVPAHVRYWDFGFGGTTQCNLDFDFASGAAGDDAALIDDHHDSNATLNCDPGHVWLWGLEPGTYDVYTYAFRSLLPAQTTTDVLVTPVGLATENISGGASWSGSHALGTTYTLHTVGTSYLNRIELYLASTVIPGHVPFNGMQIVKRDAAESYCTAKTNSCGVQPTISTHGLPSLFTISSVLNSSFWVVWGPVAKAPNLGILIATTDGPLTTPIQHPLGFGWLCITPGPGFTRVLPAVTPSGGVSNCEARYWVDFGSFLNSGGMPWVPAEVAANGSSEVDVQGWYRDPGTPEGANLTGAVRFTVRP